METKEQREARRAADHKYCQEKIAEAKAEYKAKGYDKIMSMDEAVKEVQQIFGPFLDSE